MTNLYFILCSNCILNLFKARVKFFFKKILVFYNIFRDIQKTINSEADYTLHIQMGITLIKLNFQYYRPLFHYLYIQINLYWSNKMLFKTQTTCISGSSETCTMFRLEEEWTLFGPQVSWKNLFVLPFIIIA